MRNYRIAVALAMLALVAVGCKANYTGPERTFTNGQFNVGFNVPTGWTQGKFLERPGFVVSYENPSIGGNAPASLNLLIVVYEKDKKPLDQARDEVKKMPGSEEVNIDIIETDAGKTCEILTYRFNKNGADIQGMMALVHNTEYTAILIFTTTMEAFGKYRKDFDKCAKSLCFGK